MCFNFNLYLSYNFIKEKKRTNFLSSFDVSLIESNIEN